MPKLYSKYTLFVENLASATRSVDLRHELERAGKVLEVVRDRSSRTALVEFDKADDAEYAWKKFDGFRFDGREWRIEWATYEDFKFFDKDWTEGGLDSKRGRSRSRSASRSPPYTPRDGERRPRSPSAAKGPFSDGGRGRSPSPRRD
ncbi:hypothetical protein Rsub_06787 [Raphidocelis subcapitata]|uniref:RRM domain-containing protein n=1 Tax=Raphidocelis subcapitata TaxID=307507 RepID=A0A2V0P1E5_9CHLO|nr:hypothetical protein Rsub_06787 [Raphidocelis subcapitata]|eukprot:GBF93684.1 hypothetical protein Rsub_06787 [Raphidocelis subcapitata]